MKNSNFGWALFGIILYVIGIVAVAVYVPTPMLFCDVCSRTNQHQLEKLNFNSVSVTSPTSIRLSITDTGSVNLGLSAYYIKDSRGSMYLNQTWPGPTLSPGGSVTVDLSLTGSLSGQPFQFQSGQAYTAGLISSRNNQYPYTFTA